MTIHKRQNAIHACTTRVRRQALLAKNPETKLIVETIVAATEDILTAMFSMTNERQIDVAAMITHFGESLEQVADATMANVDGRKPKLKRRR